MTNSRQSADAVKFIAACLLNAGRAAEAEKVCSSIEGSSVELKVVMALAMAAQDKLEPASALLLSALEQEPNNKQARRHAVSLLYKQAVRRLNERDWDGAGFALGEAMALGPDDARVRALAENISSVLPLAHLRAGKRAASAAIWEEAQRRTPQNGAITHSLALLYFFEASASERDGKGESAREQWAKAFGNWVLTLYDDQFWSKWSAARKPVYDPPFESILRLKAMWADEPTRSLAAMAHERERERSRIKELQMLYWLERTTAAALYELRKIKCDHCTRMSAPILRDGITVCGENSCGNHVARPVPHTVICAGPVMLRHLNEMQAAETVANKSDTLPNSRSLTGDLAQLRIPIVNTNSEVLRICLSPSGLAFAYAANHHYDDAMRLLTDHKTASMGRS